MGQTLKVIGLSALWLVVMDICVALILSLGIGPLKSLESYFDFGRSVPGKHAVWKSAPDLGGNLYDVGWRSASLETSTLKFASEDPDHGPVFRSYGMSFVNHILRAAHQGDPTLVLDLHAGPGAPPNWVYAAFLDDRANRRAGDVAILGLLSSSVPGMASMSNRSWVFEQPAPMTYPIFRPNEDGGLSRTDPLVTSPDQERALSDDPAAKAAWDAQLEEQDALYRPEAFAAPWLDRSPFARLVRRAMATGAIETAKKEVLKTEPVLGETLRRMSLIFAQNAREDGQLPLVILVQTQGPEAPDLVKIMGPSLQKAGISYLATADHIDPSNPANFLPDGHYTPAANDILATRFQEILDQHRP